MKLKNVFLMLTAGALLLTACEKKEAVTGISVSPVSGSLTEAGKTLTLTATLAPAGTKADVSWTSSNTAVATVSGNGLTATVTAVATGEAKITAKADIFTAEAVIKVNLAGGGGEGDGTGTKDAPYSVAQVMAKSSKDKNKIDEAAVWAKGFVVGRYNSTSKAVETTDTEGHNIMLAAVAGETDKTKMICIQLPVGDIRKALSIKDNADILGKEVKVHGDITTYNTFPAIKNTDGYWLIAENKGVNPPEPGNFDVPVMTIAELRALYTGSEVNLDGKKKIVGIVSSSLKGGNSTSKKNWVITSEDNMSGIAIRFSDKDNSYELGDKVEVLLDGKLQAYKEALQFEVASVKTAKVGTGSITPRKATAAEINADISKYECCVVTVEGNITGPEGAGTYGNKTKHQTNTLTDGGATLDLFVSKYASFVGQPLPTAKVSVTGIAQQYDKKKQLIIRSLDDVK